MTEDDLYNNVVISLVKFVNQFREDEAPAADYVDWDAHAQIAELPTTPILIGPAGCGMTETKEGQEVVFSFGIGSYQDTNLVELRRLISKLYGRLTVGTRIPVVDATTGTEMSWMVVRTPRAVTPITKAEVRSLQFVELTALLDPGATSYLR